MEQAQSANHATVCHSCTRVLQAPACTLRETFVLQKQQKQQQHCKMVQNWARGGVHSSLSPRLSCLGCACIQVKVNNKHVSACLVNMTSMAPSQFAHSLSILQHSTLFMLFGSPAKPYPGEKVDLHASDVLPTQTQRSSDTTGTKLPAGKRRRPG